MPMPVQQFQRGPGVLAGISAGQNIIQHLFTDPTQQSLLQAQLERQQLLSQEEQEKLKTLPQTLQAQLGLAQARIPAMQAQTRFTQAGVPLRGAQTQEALQQVSLAPENQKIAMMRALLQEKQIEQMGQRYAWLQSPTRMGIRAARSRPGQVALAGSPMLQKLFGQTVAAQLAQAAQAYHQPLTTQPQQPSIPISEQATRMLAGKSQLPPVSAQPQVQQQPTVPFGQPVQTQTMSVAPGLIQQLGQQPPTAPIVPPGQLPSGQAQPGQTPADIVQITPAQNRQMNDTLQSMVAKNALSSPQQKQIAAGMRFSMNAKSMANLIDEKDALYYFKGHNYSTNYLTDKANFERGKPSPHYVNYLKLQQYLINLKAQGGAMEGIPADQQAQDRYGKTWDINPRTMDFSAAKALLNNAIDIGEKNDEANRQLFSTTLNPARRAKVLDQYGKIGRQYITATEQGAPPTAQRGGRINVISPEGVEGSVDASELSDYLNNRGYKRG